MASNGVTGIYYRAGTYNGETYAGNGLVNPQWFLWWDAAAASWRISSQVGILGSSYWTKAGSSLGGTFTPTAAAGSLTLENYVGIQYTIAHGVTGDAIPDWYWAYDEPIEPEKPGPYELICPPDTRKVLFLITDLVSHWEFSDLLYQLVYEDDTATAWLPCQELISQGALWSGWYDTRGALVAGTDKAIKKLLLLYSAEHIVAETGVAGRIVNLTFFQAQYKEPME